MASMSLRELINSVSSTEPVDPATFATSLSITPDELAHLAGTPSILVAVNSSASKLQAYIRQSLAILERALALNEDEAVVLKWFRESPLREFGMKTPEQLVSEGRSTAVLSYIQSIESGASG